MNHISPHFEKLLNHRLFLYLATAATRISAIMLLECMHTYILLMVLLQQHCCSVKYTLGRHCLLYCHVAK